MSSVLNVIITDAGIAEVVNAQHTGTAPVVLAQVGFGRGIYTPTADQTALHDEIKRVSTIAGGVVGSNIMHIQALDSGESAYAVYEIGVYTASGTLFAVYSQPMPILHKVANSSIMCVIDFVLAGVEPTAVTVGDTDYTLAPATTTNLGVVELATDGEVVAGTDTERAITPAGGAAAYVALSGDQTIAGQKTFSDGIESGLCINSHAHNADGQVCTYGYGYDTGYTGVRVGFFDDTGDDRDDVNNWNCYIEAMSSGTPDGVSQYSNNRVKMSSHGADNTENCYVVASNGDGEPTASMHTTYLSSGVETQNNVTLHPDDIEIQSRALSSGTETKRSTIAMNTSSVEIKSNDTKYARIKTETKNITVSGSDTQVGEIELYAQGSSGTGQIKITSRETEGASVEIFCNESGVDVNSDRVHLFTDGKIEMSAGNGIEIQSPVSLQADVIPSGQRNIGSSSAPLASLHATSLVGDLTGNVTGDVTGNVTGNLTGNIPVPDYAQIPPIGSIFLAYITVSSSSSAKGIGQIAPGSIRKAQLSIDSNGVVSAVYESAIALSSGTYTLLSAIDGLSANGNTIALVMRTS